MIIIMFNKHINVIGTTINDIRNVWLSQQLSFNEAKINRPHLTCLRKKKRRLHSIFHYVVLVSAESINKQNYECGQKWQN
jgi:hypothetical protein